MATSVYPVRIVIREVRSRGEEAPSVAVGFFPAGAHTVTEWWFFWGGGIFCSAYLSREQRHVLALVFDRFSAFSREECVASASLFLFKTVFPRSRRAGQQCPDRKKV